MWSVLKEFGGIYQTGLFLWHWLRLTMESIKKKTYYWGTLTSKHRGASNTSAHTELLDHIHLHLEGPQAQEKEESQQLIHPSCAWYCRAFSAVKALLTTAKVCISMRPQVTATTQGCSSPPLSLFRFDAIYNTQRTLGFTTENSLELYHGLVLLWI